MCQVQTTPESPKENTPSPNGTRTQGGRVACVIVGTALCCVNAVLTSLATALPEPAGRGGCAVFAIIAMIGVVISVCAYFGVFVGVFE
jgi:hypothetical protein